MDNKMTHSTSIFLPIHLIPIIWDTVCHTTMKNKLNYLSQYINASLNRTLNGFILKYFLLFAVKYYSFKFKIYYLKCKIMFYE